MMDQLGPLLAGFQQNMAKVKAEAAATEHEGTAGGGLVTVRVNGENQILKVSISPDAADDVEMLEDLVVAATNDALRRAREHTAAAMQELLGGLPIPPGMLPPGLL